MYPMSIIHIYIYIHTLSTINLMNSPFLAPTARAGACRNTTAAGAGEVSVPLVPGGVVPLRADAEGTSPGCEKCLVVWNHG